jgi:hypothetical protein
MTQEVASIMQQLGITELQAIRHIRDREILRRRMIDERRQARRI